MPRLVLAVARCLSGQSERESLSQLRSYVRPVATIALGLIVGWLVLAVTFDRVFARRVPAVALAWNPGSADANVSASDLLLQTSDVNAAMPEIAARATRSLERQPVNAGAARLLATVMAARGDTVRAARLAAYAQAMSRRDLLTQLWLIEAAVQRGDVPTALVHYDRALKTSAQARAILFPILTAAAGAPAVWRPLTVFLARRPQWWRDFVDQLVPRSSSPDALYAIARRTGIERPATADPFLLQAIEKRLVDLGAYRAAADLFNRAHGRAPDAPLLLADGGFERPGGWDPFEWNLQELPDLAAVRQPSVTGKGSALFLTADNGQSGDVATQLVMLAPGRYAMAALVGGVHGDPAAYPRFVVRCANSGQTLFDTPFPPSADAGRAWHGAFIVPTGCPAQRVVIRANSALDDGAGATAWVDDLTIRPESR